MSNLFFFFEELKILFFLLLRNTDEAGEIFFKKTDENDINKKREKDGRRGLFIFLVCFRIEQNRHQRD